MSIRNSGSWYHTGDVWADRLYDETYDQEPNAHGDVFLYEPYRLQLCETVDGRYFVRFIRARGSDVCHPIDKYRPVWKVLIEVNLDYAKGMKSIRDIRHLFPAINKENSDQVFQHIRKIGNPDLD